MKNVFFYSLFVLSTVFFVGCQKEEVSSSIVAGSWNVSKVDIVINGKITPISAKTFNANFKSVKHVFNEDFTYEFTDIDGSKLNVTWEYLNDSKEVVIDYPEIDYQERFEVVTSSETELVLRTPIVEVSKANSDQDYETIFSASLLLIDSSSNTEEPKTVGILYKLTK